MTFSNDEIQTLINKVEKGEARARKRTIVAILVPTVAAILYLGFTVWLIGVKQRELETIEADLSDRKQELSQVTQELSQVTQELNQVEQTLLQTYEEIGQVEQEIAQGNIEAAQEQIANISTNFRENEINGFRAILDGDLGTARRLFQAAYDAYPTYHNVDEIYNRVLTSDRISAYNAGSLAEKQVIQQEIMQEIVTNYSWGMPEALLTEMKSRLES